MTNTEIKKLWKAAVKAKKATKAATYDDEVTMNELDAIVDAECDALDALASGLIEFTGGMLGRLDAQCLVYDRFEAVGALLARLAA